MNGNRDFKGVWISREIWLSRDLSPNEKVLLAEIDSLDNDEERGCFASDEYLAEFLQVKPGTLANMLTKLKKDGYIERIFFDGRRRGLRTRFSRHSESRVHKKMKSDFTKKLTQTSQKNEHIYRSNNKDYNKGEYYHIFAVEDQNQEHAKNGRHAGNNDSLSALSLNGEDLTPPGSAHPPLPKKAEEFEQAFVEMNNAYYFLERADGKRAHPHNVEKAYPNFKRELWSWCDDYTPEQLKTAWLWYLKNKQYNFNQSHSPRVFMKNLAHILNCVDAGQPPEVLWADKNKEKQYV